MIEFVSNALHPRPPPPEPTAYILEEHSAPLAPLTEQIRPTFFGAAYMLVHPQKSMRQGSKKCFFNMSMSFLQKHWRPSNPYPLFLITNRPWKRHEVVEIRRKWPALDLSFLDVSAVFNVLPRLEPHHQKFNNFSTEYKQMCAFNFYGFMQVQSLLRYRYLMRIDDDTCLLDAVNFDLFKDMAARNASYGYAAYFNDPFKVTAGMNDFASAYMTERAVPWANPALRQLAVDQFAADQSAPCFATNWEVIDTLRYRAADILSFVQSVKDSRMIFYRRWGDAPLRFLLAEMFWGPREVLRFCDFAYQHGKQNTFPPCEERTEVDPVLRYDRPPFNRALP